MPIWLIILVSCLSTILFVLLCHIFLMVFGAREFRDNIIFKNKNERKIYFLGEKLKKIDRRIKDKISNLKYKSIYVENIKILHEKSLDSAVLLSSKDFIKSKKRGK